MNTTHEHSLRDCIDFLISKSHYACFLHSRTNEIYELVELNDELRTTVGRLYRNSGFQSTGRMNLKTFQNEWKLIEHFFEYLYFTSSDFIAQAKKK